MSMDISNTTPAPLISIIILYIITISIYHTWIGTSKKSLYAKTFLLPIILLHNHKFYRTFYLNIAVYTIGMEFDIKKKHIILIRKYHLIFT